MTAHRFDPLSGVLGVIAVVAGLLVMTDSVDRADADGVWWLALAALALGVTVVASAVRRLTPDEAS